jgi:hypothetical protein
MEALLQLFLIPKRWKFRRDLKKSQPVSEELIRLMRSRCEEAQQANWNSYFGLYNVGLFVALLNKDITTYNESIFFARSAWHRQFHARNLAVLLYETTEDLPQLLGKSFRAWLTDIDLGQAWLDSLGRITSQIALFKSSHSSFLKDVRNYIGAHREHESLAQISMLESLDPLVVYKLAGDLAVPVNDLVGFYIKLLTYMHNPAVMLKQACRAVDRA